MIDVKELAAADCLVHTKLGVVSYQPESIHSVPGSVISVRDIDFNLHWVLASDCELASSEEHDQYWSKNKY